MHVFYNRVAHRKTVIMCNIIHNVQLNVYILEGGAYIVVLGTQTGNKTDFYRARAPESNYL